MTNLSRAGASSLFQHYHPQSIAQQQEKLPSHHLWKGELLIPVQVTGPQRKFSVSQTRASDLWLSQPGPGVLELFTDQLDPDSGSVIVEVKKKIDLN